MIRAVRDFGLWALYYPIRWIVVCLPVGASRFLGEVSGGLHAGLSRLLGTGRLQENMESLLGPEQAASAARTYLRRKHQTLLEHFLISFRGRRVVARLLGEIRGREHLDAVRREGRGAVLALFHFGNIRMLSALGYEGYPLVQLLNRTAAHAGRGHSRALARRVRNVKVDMDRSMPARFLHWEPGVRAREVYRVPTQGEFLLVHLDGSRGGSFESFDFLGAHAPFATGAARIARRMNVPLLPVFCLRRGDGRHDLIIERPVTGESSVRGMTARCVQLLEQYVRSHPEQWWTWARLELEVDEQGRIQMEPRPAVTAEEHEAVAGAAR